MDEVLNVTGVILFIALILTGVFRVWFDEVWLTNLLLTILILFIGTGFLWYVNSEDIKAKEKGEEEPGTDGH